MRRGEGPSSRLTFRLDPPVREKLKWTAEIAGVPESNIVRRALDAYLRESNGTSANDEETL